MSDDKIFIVMELFLEGSLDKVYFQEEGFTSETNGHIMKQLFQALKYLHETKKIIHRDLKVENILVEKVDEDNDKVYIKLIDFGFATLLDSEQYQET